MKIAVFLILLIPVFVSSQNVGNQTFKQDIAVKYTTKNGFAGERVTSIYFDNGYPVAAFENSRLKWDGKKWNPFDAKRSNDKLKIILPEEAGEVLCSVKYKSDIYAGAENGLYCLSEKGKQWQQILPRDEKYSWSPSKVAAMTVDSNGNLWFGADQGVGCLSEKKWNLYTGKEGLPYNHFTCAASGKDGIVWFGTEKGAIRFENGQFRYRFSLRWLPDDYVNAIAIDDAGIAWIATNNGVGKIITRNMTFDEKASYFTWQTETRHLRMGFIAPNELTVAYDTASFKFGISDNDGMYTSMYGAAQAFRYAITGENKAKELAKRSFEACKWLAEITDNPGFVARVIVPYDWPEPLADPDYSHQMNVRVQQHDPFWKDINPRFVKSKDGKYLWKCDTSSDELAGHYFFYGIYYDFVAETEAEKQAVRDVVASITDHMIRNGFLLRDHDGKPTRWGNFSPEYMNSVWGWDQRGLNSMMMLSFLNVASHITGDKKYEEAATLLRDKYNYHVNAMHAKEFFPPENVVPWDNNLCLMSMFGLINYEKNPELLIMYRNSLENAWLHISKQKNAFWNALYAAMSGHFSSLAEKGYFNTGKVFQEAGNFTQIAVKMFSEYPDLGTQIKETLEYIPLDLVGYKMDNTHRLDVEFDPTPAQVAGKGWRNDGYAVPVDERGHVRQDRDGFDLIFQEVGGGNAEQEGTFFLLPYYMAQYYKLLK